MVNYIWETTNLVNVVDCSGITQSEWDPTVHKWTKITTLTPTITNMTVFYGSHPVTKVIDNYTNLINAVRETWTTCLSVKTFSIPFDAGLATLPAGMEVGDTIEIRLRLKNTGRADIVLALLYTHTASSYPGIDSVSSSTIPTSTATIV